MEFLEKFFKKRFRLIYQDIDVAFEKNAKINHIDEEDVDDTFYTFGFIPVEHSVLYSLILPAAAEEHLDDILKSFVEENEFSDVELRYYYAYVKEKGKLKVLIGVLRDEIYNDFRNSFYNYSHTLSGIIPYQMVLIAHALRNGVKEGIAVYKKDGFILGFLFKDGFPMAFLKVKERENTDVLSVIERFMSAERIEKDTNIYLFGSEFEGIEGENIIVKLEDIDFVNDAVFLLEAKSIPVINYLPEKERKVIIRWWKYVFAGIVILGFLIYSSIFLKDYLTLKSEVQRLKSDFNNKKTIALKLRKKIGNVDDLKRAVLYFTKLEKDKKKILILLEELTRRIPKSAYLTRLTINDRGDIELNGKAKDVYAVVKSLSNSKYFRKVEKKSSREAGDYTIFIIRGKVVY